MSIVVFYDNLLDPLIHIYKVNILILRRTICFFFFLPLALDGLMPLWVLRKRSLNF